MGPQALAGGGAFRSPTGRVKDVLGREPSAAGLGAAVDVLGLLGS